MATRGPRRTSYRCSTDKATCCCTGGQKPSALQGVVTKGAVLTRGLATALLLLLSLMGNFFTPLGGAAAGFSWVSFSGWGGDHFANSSRHLSLPMPLLPSPHSVCIHWILARRGSLRALLDHFSPKAGNLAPLASNSC